MNVITLISLGIVGVLATSSVAAHPSTPSTEKKAAPRPVGTSKPSHHEDSPMHQNVYVGMWVTADGHIRQELLPNGRYDEARGNRRRAYQGRYEVRGNRINYWDDTGFTADGTFVNDDELHHGGMIFYRQK